jgi:cell division septum initiation protein DivIVA
MSSELTRTGEALFKSARRGYDRADVDTYVAQLQREVRELQAQLQSPDAAVRSALERVGEEVGSLLKRAHDTADEIVATGQREADDHREQAARHAAHVTAVAEQRVHELDLDTDRIWGERERMVADARDLARQLNRLADLAAERFPQDADGQHAAGQDRGHGLDASARPAPTS